jgi:hypothetical protein
MMNSLCVVTLELLEKNISLAETNTKFYFQGTDSKA